MSKSLLQQSFVRTLHDGRFGTPAELEKDSSVVTVCLCMDCRGAAQHDVCCCLLGVFIIFYSGGANVMEGIRLESVMYINNIVRLFYHESLSIL